MPENMNTYTNTNLIFKQNQKQQKSIYINTSEQSCVYTQVCVYAHTYKYK